MPRQAIAVLPPLISEIAEHEFVNCEALSVRKVRLRTRSGTAVASFKSATGSQPPELDEQAELVGSDPLPNDLVVLELHDRDPPLLDRPSGRRPSRVSPGVRPAEPGPEQDRVPGDDQFVNVEVKVGKCLVIPANNLASGRWPPPEGVGIGFPIEVSGGGVVSAVPDFVDKPPDLRLAFGSIHGSPRFEIFG